MPAFVISTEDDDGRARKQGAAGFAHKLLMSRDGLRSVFASIDRFLERKRKAVLVVEPDAKVRDDLLNFIEPEGIDKTTTETVVKVGMIVFRRTAA